jgi:2Fe-2S ferredoxin
VNQYSSQYRCFSRSSLDAPETTPYDKAVAFVVSVGYEKKIAQGVVDALVQSGLSAEALLSMVRALAGRWEVGEDEGLEALAASVKQDLARKTGQKIILHIVPPNAWDSAEDPSTENITPCLNELGDSTKSRAFTVEAYEGTSLTDVAKFGTGHGADTLGEYLECACAGIMACSTCHVIVDKDWFARVGPPSEDEQDMLDLAYGPRPSSRLGCQIVLTSALDGAVLYLPKGQNNIMDHIPFEG